MKLPRKALELARIHGFDLSVSVLTCTTRFANDHMTEVAAIRKQVLSEHRQMDMDPRLLPSAKRVPAVFSCIRHDV